MRLGQTLCGLVLERLSKSTGWQNTKERLRDSWLVLELVLIISLEISVELRSGCRR